MDWTHHLKQFIPALVLYWYLCVACLVLVWRLHPVPQLAPPVLLQQAALPLSQPVTAGPDAPWAVPPWAVGWLRLEGCCVLSSPPRVLPSAGWSPAPPPRHRLKRAKRGERENEWVVEDLHNGHILIVGCWKRLAMLLNLVWLKKAVKIDCTYA